MAKKITSYAFNIMFGVVEIVDIKFVSDALNPA